jgi:hypothetical protein
MIRPILRMANESRSRVLDVSKTLFSNRSSTRAPQHRCSPASPFAYRPVLHRATLPYMRRVLMSLLVLAPALSAQVRSRATAVFSNPAASLVVPRLGVDVGFDGPDVGWNESQFTAFFGRPRVSGRSVPSSARPSAHMCTSVARGRRNFQSMAIERRRRARSLI